jgi:hypothetical protein
MNIDTGGTRSIKKLEMDDAGTSIIGNSTFNASVGLYNDIAVVNNKLYGTTSGALYEITDTAETKLYNSGSGLSFIGLVGIEGTNELIGVDYNAGQIDFYILDVTTAGPPVLHGSFVVDIEVGYDLIIANGKYYLSGVVGANNVLYDFTVDGSGYPNVATGALVWSTLDINAFGLVYIVTATANEVFLEAGSNVGTVRYYHTDDIALDTPPWSAFSGPLTGAINGMASNKG